MREAVLGHWLGRSQRFPLSVVSIALLGNPVAALLHNCTTGQINLPTVFIAKNHGSVVKRDLKLIVNIDLGHSLILSIELCHEQLLCPVDEYMHAFP